MIRSKSLQTFVLVRDLRTELVVQPFSDRILVLVSQIGKVGSLIQVSIPSTTDIHPQTSADVSDLMEPFLAPSPGIQLTTIFGSAPSAHMQNLYSLYAAHAATLVWQTVDEPRSVIVGIALRHSQEHKEEELSEVEQQTFHAVMKALWLLLK